MTKNRRKKGSRNIQKRKGSRSGAGQSNPNLTQVSEPRDCACPLHETFWVTVGSKQEYAFPKCRKRAFDMRKKQALMQLIFNGLVKLGSVVEKALQIAQRAIQRFYTRYVKLVEECGYRYNAKQSQWIKE